MSLIINFFGGPGIGKSTQSSSLFTEMKKIATFLSNRPQRLIKKHDKTWSLLASNNKPCFLETNVKFT